MKTQKKPKLKRWDEIIKRFPKEAKINIAEIGVDTGKLSSRILAHFPNLTLYMVDWWKVPPSDGSYAKSGAQMAGYNQSYFDAAFHKCVDIAKIYKGRAHILKKDSVEAAEAFGNGFFDLVFIDGDHSYAGCKRDAIAWLPKVKAGGWIGGHDYNHPDQGEVKKAVDELFAGKDIILGENRTWWVKV